MLDDPAVVEHDHLVDHPQRRQLVGDDDRRAPGRQLGEGGLELGLGGGIDARRGLVEHDEVRPPQPDPRHRQQLGLSGRQASAGGTEDTFDAAGRERTQTGSMQGVDDVGIGRDRVEQGDVVADRALEQLDLLRHEGDPPAQLGHRDVGDRNTAEPHGAAGRLDEAQQQPGERGLAAAGAADDADRAAAADDDVDVVERQRLTRTLVPERDVVQVDRQRSDGRGHRAGIDDRRLQVEQVDDAHHRAVRLLHRLQLVDQLLQRPFDEQQVLEQQERGADRDQPVGDEQPAGDESRSRCRPSTRSGPSTTGGGTLAPDARSSAASPRSPRRTAPARAGRRRSSAGPPPPSAAPRCRRTSGRRRRARRPTR